VLCRENFLSNRDLYRADPSLSGISNDGQLSTKCRGLNPRVTGQCARVPWPARRTETKMRFSSWRQLAT